MSWIDWLKANGSTVAVVGLLVLIAGNMGLDRYNDWQKPGRTSGTKAVNKEDIRKQLGMLTSGISPECAQEQIASDRRDIDRKMMADQKELEKMGLLTPIAPTSDPLGSTQRVAVDGRLAKAVYPLPTHDVLDQIGMTLENQYGGRYGVTDEAIRGVADRVFDKIGIADASLRGWTLSVRPAEGGAMTTLDEDRQVAIIMIEPGGFAWNIDHEMAHVLSGPAFINNDKVVTIAKEYIAIAAESVDPSPDFRKQWDYNRQNLAILGMGKSINGESGVIHAANAPLDGWRYDVLRLTDEKIGEEGQVALGQAIYKQALADKELTVGGLEHLFNVAGVNDLKVFKPTLERGLYLDLAFTKRGTPIILAKTIDADGFEGITPTPMQVVWRDSDGSAMGSAGPMPLSPFVGLDGMETLMPYVAAIEVRVAGEPYTFTFGNGVTNATGNDIKPDRSVPSSTKSMH